MKTARKTSLADVDGMFRAFSDRTRLRILHLLKGGESCVCDLVDVLGVAQPKVSRHLAYLRRARLVVVRQEGLWKYYGLAPARNTFHARLLRCLSDCFCDVPQLAKDAQRMGGIRSPARCCLER